MNLTEKDITRFWSKVNKNADHPKGCWEWTAGASTKGYGLIRVQQKSLKAHRISYQLVYGEFPQELHVLHQCDNPACVNPKHLFLGTQADNVHDMDNKDRRANFKGEIHGRAKLTNEQIIEIRSRYVHGSKINGACSLAREYGVHNSTIYRIIFRKRWSHI